MQADIHDEKDRDVALKAYHEKMANQTHIGDVSVNLQSYLNNKYAINETINQGGENTDGVYATTMILQFADKLEKIVREDVKSGRTDINSAMFNKNYGLLLNDDEK